MDFIELNERLSAAGAPPVYFARYTPDDPPGGYATGGYLGVAISIVDHGEYLAWGTSERSEFNEAPEHFATESDIFRFLLTRLTTPSPPPRQLTPEEGARAEDGARRARELFEAMRREKEAGSSS